MKLTEAEYFIKQEIENKQAYAEKIKGDLQEKERQELKELHWMRCPKCGFELHTIEFRGVAIDKCFHCGGVFLDDGELEQLAGKESHFLQNVLQLFKSK